MGSIITIIVVMIVVTTTVTYTTAPLATATSVSSSKPTQVSTSSQPPPLRWFASTSYPTEIWTQSCASYGGYIYCVGGLDGTEVSNITASVYFAELTPTGVGPWTMTTSYPMSIRSASCVASGGDIYCIGGYNATSLTSEVYYAAVSPTGVGKWTRTSSYPTGIWTQSCAATGLGVYCVGGESPAENEVNSVYFSRFTSSGLGPWNDTTGYPVGVRQQSCVATASDLYCIGGLDYTAVNFAPIISSGVGTWSNTTGYPFTVGANLLSCSVIDTTVYCVAGHTGPNVSNDTYYASLTTSGVGPWMPAGSYPIGVWGLSCVSSGEAIYCAGGETASGSLTDTVAYLSSA